MDDTVTRVIPSIDWLTVTAVDEERREALWQLGNELVNKQMAQKVEARAWRWKSYTGYHVGTVTVGRRHDSTILQLSQGIADECFARAWASADHCTRLDLAVTVWGGDEVGNLAERHERECLDWQKGGCKTLKTKTISDNGRINTLYLGSRESDLFARCYDKRLESGDSAFDGAWRYELEIKGDPAQRTASYLSAAVDRAGWVRGAVFKYFARRGIQPIFGSVGSNVSISTIRPVTDQFTRLAWLTNQVRPCVQKLLADDLGEEVMDALGIPRSLLERWRLKWFEEGGSHFDQLAFDDEAT